MGDPKISYHFINAAARNKLVQAGLLAVAARVKRRAEGIAAAEDVQMKVTLKPGVRPGGRAYVDVVGDNSDQEFGAYDIPRLRILGRAGAEG